MHELDDGNGERFEVPSSHDVRDGARRKQELMVTVSQKKLIRNTWESMRPMAVHVADLFFDRLFELDPSLEDRFPDDPGALRVRFTKAVSTVVGSLDDLDDLRSVLHDLGRRHANQGLGQGHYATVGMALLWTFEQTLDEAFTPAVEDAWAALHGVLSRLLTQAGDARQSGSAPRGHAAVHLA